MPRSSTRPRRSSSGVADPRRLRPAARTGSGCASSTSTRPCARARGTGRTRSSSRCATLLPLERGPPPHRRRSRPRRRRTGSPRSPPPTSPRSTSAGSTPAAPRRRPDRGAHARRRRARRLPLPHARSRPSARRCSRCSEVRPVCDHEEFGRAVNGIGQYFSPPPGRGDARALRADPAVRADARRLPGGRDRRRCRRLPVRPVGARAARCRAAASRSSASTRRTAGAACCGR